MKHIRQISLVCNKPKLEEMQVHISRNFAMFCLWNAKRIRSGFVITIGIGLAAYIYI